MKSEIFISKSPKKTMEIARIIFLKFQKLFKDRKNGLLFALVGPLGSGKTIFVQGMAKFLGIKDRIQSPTFLIYKEKIKKIYKEIINLLKEKKVEKAKKQIPLYYKIVDKAAKIGIIKKNRASRKKSKIMKLINKEESS